MIVSGYTLDLYCDFPNCPNNVAFYTDPVQFFNDSPNCYYEVRKSAKKSGWKLKRNGTCFCPLHNKKR
jgi:hypothetical protein